MKFFRIAALLTAFIFSGMGQAQAQDSASDAVSGGILGALIGTIVKKPRDTETLPTSTRRVPPLRPFNQQQLSRDEVRQVQTILNDFGIKSGTPDGIAGKATRRAIDTFRAMAGATWTGGLSLLDHSALTTAQEWQAANPTLDRQIILRQAVTAVKRDSLDALEPRRTVAIASAAPPSAVPQIPSRGLGPPTPTRLFAVSQDYPPDQFRGYGIVAFKSLATKYDKLRHNILCEAYVASMQSSALSASRIEDQFVTIWPLKTRGIAQDLNFDTSSGIGDVCLRAIPDYSQQVAEQAINAAKAAGFDDQGIGPFLLGWLPGRGFGKKDALILVIDLSKVESYPQALSLFQEWKTDIQSDPELRSGAFSVEYLRRKVRRWSDQFGTGLFSFLLN